ncbi:hypothetical protein ACFYMW_03070 [Streptomyces sp. NPDC006692]|uniref:hypothetical protein n=1 Tax=Streptomyces sp. NPDC006692 TaxID=3364758 RepID=UPI0036B4130E
MTSDTTRTTRQPDHVADLAKHIGKFGPWALLNRRPQSGYAEPHAVDLRAIKSALERLIS